LKVYFHLFYWCFPNCYLFTILINEMNQAQPIPQNSRIVIVDIIRGFALFGVLIANLTGFITFALPEKEGALLVTTPVDKFTEHFVSLFIEGKFITIFSMLFGYGFGVLIERVAQRGVQVNRFFTRRMIILLLFGLVHLAIWWGEILNVYAMAGLLMLLFRKMETKKLLWWGLILLFIGGTFIQALKILLLPPPGEKLDSLLAYYEKCMLSGNLWSIIKGNYTISAYFFVERWSQYRDVAEALGKFLLGYYVFRSGYLTAITSHIKLIRKVFSIALVIAILYLAKKIALDIFGGKPEAKPVLIIDYLASNAGILSFSLVYCTFLVKLYHKMPGLKIFKGLASVGMMSLTNYLSQTIFYLIFFYGFGFAMIGKLHLQWIIPVAVLLFSLQVVISMFWVKRFRFGPAEWIWRMLSYRQYFPIKK